MKRFIVLSLAVVAVATAAFAADNALTAKAARAMAQHEWANAQALYLLLEDKSPENAAAYCGHMVASEMRGQSVEAVATLRRGLEAGVAADSILNPFRSAIRALGKPQAYPTLLEAAAEKMPWMSRVFDARLLNYYAFRRNTPQTIKYADKLLAGLPTDTRFLLTLGTAQMDAGNMDAAVNAWERVLAADPKNFDALVALGNYYYLSGNFDAAAPYLHRAYDIKPTPYLHSLLKKQ